MLARTDTRRTPAQRQRRTYFCLYSAQRWVPCAPLERKPPSVVPTEYFLRVQRPLGNGYTLATLTYMYQLLFVNQDRSYEYPLYKNLTN